MTQRLNVEEAKDKGLTSMDIAEEKKALFEKYFKQFFPEAFTEDKIDFDQLRRVLGDFVDADKERFGLNWPGKANCMKIIQQPSVATLKPAREESVDFDNTENLFIEGDNLEVLKLLQKAYFGKVKMIYIDPPYNTGGEFIYPDKYAENLDTYLEYTGQKDSEGRKFATNTDTVGRYHSNWLNMMYPRLYLAKNLLREDGLIFISIDDNEQANLKKMCDDIFGEENFIDSICWKKKYGGGAKEKYLVSVHEYILIYAKNKPELPEILVPFDEKKARRFYKFKDDKFETLGYYRTHPLEAVKSFDLRDNLRFPITAPDGSEVWPKRQWRWSRERFEEAFAKDEVIFNQKENGTWVLSSKQYLNDESGVQRKTKAQSIIDDIFTQEGTKEIFEIFGDAKIFPFPKPVNLLHRLLQIGGVHGDDLVLDFFAGSGTLSHAVLKFNSENNSTCRHISVQLPELTEEKSEAHKAGFVNLADISKERIRRVTSLVAEENPDYKGDLGFKVFKLAKSNFNIWEGNVEEIDDLSKQLEMAVDHVQETAKPEDILYELLLKAGFSLTTKVEKQTMAGKEVFSVEGGAMLICLEKQLTQDVLDAMAEVEPFRVVCLDVGFKGNDELKANAVQTFKSRARDKESAITFTTV